MDNTIKFKITDSLFKLFFDSQGIICGSPIREYVLPSKENKTVPSDYYIHAKNYETFLKMVQSALSFCFEIKVDQCHKIVDLHLEYKFNPYIKTTIHIYPKDFPIPNLYLDVNNIVMLQPDHYIVSNGTSIMDIVNQINNKQFKILKSFKIPKGNRRQLGIVESSTDLLCFVETMYYTAKMLETGWRLEGQTLEKVFEPNLIKEVKDSKEENCDICSEKFNKYELELNCCKKMICFKCAINQVKNRFDNSEINCPFCRGDLFGWKTNRIVEKKAYVDDDDMPQLVDDEFDDMPPLDPTEEPRDSHENSQRLMEAWRDSLGQQWVQAVRARASQNALSNSLYGRLGAPVNITNIGRDNLHRLGEFVGTITSEDLSRPITSGMLNAHHGSTGMNTSTISLEDIYNPSTSIMLTPRRQTGMSFVARNFNPTAHVTTSSGIPNFDSGSLNTETEHSSMIMID